MSVPSATTDISTPTLHLPGDAFERMAETCSQSRMWRRQRCEQEQLVFASFHGLSALFRLQEGIVMSHMYHNQVCGGRRCKQLQSSRETIRITCPSTSQLYDAGHRSCDGFNHDVVGLLSHGQPDLSHAKTAPENPSVIVRSSMQSGSQALSNDSAEQKCEAVVMIELLSHSFRTLHEPIPTLRLLLE